MKLTVTQLRRIIKEEVKKALLNSEYVSDPMYDHLKEGFLDSFNAGFSSVKGGGAARADGDIDLDSLNYSMNKFTTEQRGFLKNLVAMNSDQLASQYSDISKEMNGRRSMVPHGTPDEEIIKMILDTAYPALDLYGT